MKIREYMTLDNDEVRCAIQNYVEDCGRQFVVREGETKPRILVSIEPQTDGTVKLYATIEIEREQQQPYNSEEQDDDIPF